jgi:hypothetical protein
MNDLVLLKYKWGHRPDDGSGFTDCFQLTCEVMRRMGFRDYSLSFQWVYDTYTEQTFPRRKIMRWLLENGTKIANSKPGAVALLPGDVGPVLGAATDSGVIFISPGRQVVHAPIHNSFVRYFWMK